MSIHISDLPLEYQRQALATLQKQTKPAKHHNEKVTTQSGLKFDSKLEERRFNVLALQLAAGNISDLKLQPEFTLQEAYTTPEGKRVRAVRYRADFSYYRDDALVVEDTKSAHTRKLPVYRMKSKLMQERLGITIREILNPDQPI